MTKQFSDSWEDVVAAKIGKILVDQFDNGFRFLVMRGPAALCAYFGVSKDHPLAGRSYDDIPIECHGGLTYATEGKGNWPEGWYWYGWDYAHCDDYVIYDDTMTTPRNGKKWTVKTVVKDSWWTIESFKKLAQLMEAAINDVPKDKQPD